MEMSESAIVAKTQPDEVKTSEINPNPDHMGKINVKDWIPLYKYLNLDESIKNDKALSQIWEWAKSQSPDQHNDSILWQIIKLNNKLGSAGLGENSYSKLFNYVTIWNRQKESEELLKDIELKKVEDRNG